MRNARRIFRLAVSAGVLVIICTVPALAVAAWAWLLWLIYPHARG